MSPKQLRARAEAKIAAIVRSAEALAVYFSRQWEDIDGNMERRGEELAEFTREWAREQREYIAEAVKHGFWDGI